MKRPVPRMVALLVLCSSFAAASEKKPRIVHFDLSPAAPPDPALKYTLIPPPSEQIPGAAAPFYLVAETTIPETVKLTDGSTKDLDDLVETYLAMPLSELKKSDAELYVHRDMAHHFLELGSLHTRADWPNSMRQDGIATLLPYLNSLRSTARLTVAYARLQLANGDIPGAIQSYRILLTLAHQLQEDGVLVQDLVGAGIAELALDHLTELLQRPDAPNLYWALASLPHPIFDLGTAINWEKLTVRASLGPLRNNRSPEDLTPAEWIAVTNDFVRLINNMATPSNSGQQQLVLAAYSVTFYSHAKQILVTNGIPSETVNAMPVPQALGMAMLHTFDHWNDEYAKWASLPFFQANSAINRTAKALQQARDNDAMNPAYILIPNYARSYITSAYLERHVAALQTIEALRAFAAAHDHHLPTSLDQLTDTPAPDDPVTGHPFTYTLTTPATADLTSSPADNTVLLHYTITLRN